MNRHNYRIVGMERPAETLFEGMTIKQTKAAAKSFAADGTSCKIQCYVYGIGWVDWRGAMGERKAKVKS